MPQKRSVKNIEKLFDNKYQILEIKNKIIVLKCKKCNNVFEKTRSSIMHSWKHNKKICPFCEISSKNMTFSQIQFKIKNADKNNEYKLLSHNNICTLLHKKCNNTFKIKLSHFINNNRRCPYCSHRHSMYSTEEVKEKIKNICGDEYSLIGDYNGLAVPARMRHNTCGYEWDCNIHNFFRGSRCPKCQKSKGEVFIDNYLLEMKVEYKREYSFPNLKRMRFDFYIPEINTVIEFDGEQHFHEWRKITDSHKKLKSMHKRDNIKNKFCKDNNINILRIKYYMTQNEIMKILDLLINKNIDNIDSTTIANKKYMYNNKNKNIYYRDYYNKKH